MTFPDFEKFSPVRIRDSDTVKSVARRAREANAFLLQKGELRFVLYGKLGEPAFLSRYALWCYLHPKLAVAINMAVAEIRKNPFVILEGEKEGK